jgi:hypothetical protein
MIRVPIEDIQIGKLYSINYYSIDECINVNYTPLLCFDILDHIAYFYDINQRNIISHLFQQGTYTCWSAWEILS